MNQIYRVTASALKLRSKADKTAPQLAFIMKGQQVISLDDPNPTKGWTHINWNGKTGFVASDFIVPLSPVVAPPPPPPPLPVVESGDFSRYFSLEELTASETATRRGIDNSPSDQIVEHLRVTAGQMDRVRELLGAPIHINSGYRCPRLNTAIGGSTTSSHMTGYAIDFVCRSFGSPLDVCRKIIASGIAFDQLIQEGTWVHISFDPRMRGKKMTASFSGGKASYSDHI